MSTYGYLAQLQGGWMFFSTRQMERRRRAIRYYARLPDRWAKLTARERVILSLFAGLNPARYPIGYTAIANILGQSHGGMWTTVLQALHKLSTKGWYDAH